MLWNETLEELTASLALAESYRDAFNAGSDPWTAAQNRVLAIKQEIDRRDRTRRAMAGEVLN